jgi:hypothetical protein
MRALGRLAAPLLLALWVALPAALSAQTPGRAAPLLELPAGARAVGLGGAAQLGAADSDHMFQHPAYLGVGGFRATAWLVDASGSAISLSTGTGAFGGRVALGVRAAEWTGVSPDASAGGLDGIFDTGDAGRSTTALTLGYARAIPFDLDLGVTATLVADRVDTSRPRTVAVDVGLGTEVGPLALALTARNLGNDLEFGSTAVPLPTRYEFAAGGYGQQLGPLDLGAAVRAGIRDDDEFVYGGGLELGYYPIQGRTFIARVGGQSVPEGDGAALTLGGSYRGDELTIDYAWRDVDGLAVHTITLGWR